MKSALLIACLIACSAALAVESKDYYLARAAEILATGQEEGSSVTDVSMNLYDLRIQAQKDGLNAGDYSALIKVCERIKEVYRMAQGRGTSSAQPALQAAPAEQPSDPVEDSVPQGPPAPYKFSKKDLRVLSKRAVYFDPARNNRENDPPNEAKPDTVRIIRAPTKQIWKVVTTVKNTSSRVMTNLVVQTVLRMRNGAKIPVSLRRPIQQLQPDMSKEIEIEVDNAVSGSPVSYEVEFVSAECAE